MTSTKTLWIAYAGVVLTAAFSLFSLRSRYHVEARNRAVEIAVELEGVEALAVAQRLPLEGALQRLKAGGVGAAVLSEQKVGELVDDGLLTMQSGSAAKADLELSAEPETMKRVIRGLSIRLHYGTGIDPNGPLYIRDFSPNLIRATAVGLDPAFVAAAKDAGLRIIARGDNPTGASREAVIQTLAWFKEDGASIFLPQGEQVLGRRENLDIMLERLETSGMLYASPEFAKIGGDLNVLAKAPERVVRLHAAQSLELDKLTFADAVDRYVRAASERSMRVLLVRPISLSSEAPLDEFAEFIREIRRKMEREGLSVGPAKPFIEPETPEWVFPAIGLSASIVAVCAASLFVTQAVWLGLIGLVSVALGLAAFKPEFRGYAALMAAFVFPVAAYGFLEGHRHRVIFIHFALMIGVSLVGGLAVAGLLNDLPYFIRADQFPGVKLAHFGPILAAGLFMGTRLVDWRGGLRSPVTWMQAVLAIVLLMALAFMFMRTGNDNPAAVSGFEMRLRSLLDNILPVRPRTKEFMIGYPALVFGLGLLMRIRAKGAEADALRGWCVLLLAIGGIALTSVVNTMCHLHTPLQVGFIRILVGAVLGGIIGGGAWSVLRYGLPRAKA